MITSLIFILVFITFFTIVLSENYKKYKFSFGICCIFVLGFVLIAIFRPGNILPDYNNYVDFYYMRGEERFEPSAKLFRLISPNVYVFFFWYAMVAITCKVKACCINSYLPIFSIITSLYI